MISRAKPLRIDFIAPPYAGHLFPLLDLIKGYAAECEFPDDGDLFQPRILTTANAENAVKQSGLQHHFLLRGFESRVAAISDKDFQVSRNPFKLYAQFQENLALMPILRDELIALWKGSPPDIAVVDFCVPIAGHVAQKLGIRWWTSIPTPCAIETRSGTPSYLGGWLPAKNMADQVRNWCGRAAVRTFKRAAFFACRKHLTAIGFTRLYRSDATEMTYSPEKIYALGAREFELNSDWPRAVKFIGPLTGGPASEHDEPNFETSRIQVLISMGTHLSWSKNSIQQLVTELAAQLPDIDFHITAGGSDVARNGFDDPTNLFRYKYLPYDLYVNHFDAAIVHGGTGVTYSCLKAGVPLLVWPQDFDQFDHAARVQYHGLGLWFKQSIKSASVELLAKHLMRLIDEPPFRNHCQEFRSQLQSCSPHQAFRDDLAAMRNPPCV